MTTTACFHCGGHPTAREVRVFEEPATDKNGKQHWQSRHRRVTGDWCCRECLSKLRAGIPLDQTAMDLGQ